MIIFKTLEKILKRSRFLRNLLKSNESMLPTRGRYEHQLTKTVIVGMTFTDGTKEPFSLSYFISSDSIKRLLAECKDNSKADEDNNLGETLNYLYSTEVNLSNKYLSNNTCISSSKNDGLQQVCRVRIKIEPHSKLSINLYFQEENNYQNILKIIFDESINKLEIIKLFHAIAFFSSRQITINKLLFNEENQISLTTSLHEFLIRLLINSKVRFDHLDGSKIFTTSLIMDDTIKIDPKVVIELTQNFRYEAIKKVKGLDNIINLPDFNYLLLMHFDGDGEYSDEEKNKIYEILLEKTNQAITNLLEMKVEPNLLKYPLPKIDEFTIWAHVIESSQQSLNK